MTDFDFSKLERPPNPHCKDKRFNHKLTNSTDMKLYLIDSNTTSGCISQDFNTIKTAREDLNKSLNIVSERSTAANSSKGDFTL
jgi:TnpA family transposase